VLEGYRRSVMNTFGPPKRVFVRGEGCYVWDADGRRYLDLLAGIAVNALGHAHPTVLAAVTGQISTLGHVSNFFTTPAQVSLAGRLAPLTGDPEAKVFFTNSGTEANEAAFKITRMTGRTKIISTEGAFHGRSLGALAITHNPKYRAPFEPLPGDVTFVPYGDADALAAAVTDETAAVILEPLQGEAGVVAPPLDYLARAREITREHGALLWLDEIQTGVGRTGAWYAHQNPDVADAMDGVADIVTVAKGLAGGFPIGVCLATGDAADLLQPGNHGTTFGGNPVAAAAALAVLDTIEEEGLLDHVTDVGQRLHEGLLADDRVTEVRGSGLLIGLDLSEPASAEVFAAALDAGFIVNNPTPERVRLAPPLILTAEQADSFLEAWPAILDAAYRKHGDQS
jgi:acetylornithine/N-succinyldiaminopimelate aminotransferase